MKRLLVRCGALAAVASLVGLALWPPAVRGELGGGDDARLCRGKIDALAAMASKGRAGRDSFSERELNAHLARILSRNRSAQEARGLTVGVRDLRVNLAPTPSFFVDTRLLSVPLVFTVRWACGDSGPPRPSALAVGHLPFLGPLKTLVIGRMKPLFAQLRNESLVWNHLASCKVQGEPLDGHLDQTTLLLSVDGRAQQAATNSPTLTSQP